VRGKEAVCVPLKEGDPWPAPVKEVDSWPVKKDDPLPAPARSAQGEMRIRRSLPDDRQPGDPDHLPLFLNTETHWWDGSQLYGSGEARQNQLRKRKGGRLTVIKEGDFWRLPPETDQQLNGVDLTGFNQNWWVGLSLLHTLFALEHNAICTRLEEAYPDWDDERLFQTARLINAALMAKIHTVEWTPAILGHPTLLVGMRANWQGIALLKRIGRSKLLRGLQEELCGIPGSEQDDHAAPYHLTEEFVSVYRMHPLIPDDYRLYSLATDEVLEERTFTDIQTNRTRGVMDRIKLDDLLYSLGVAHPGALTLHNFPRSLQHFHRIKDENGPLGGEILDLGAIDVFRDRERAVPRYNRFRSQLLMLPTLSYRRLVGLPLIPLLSRLTRREIEDRKRWVNDLNTHYPDRDLLDLMVGLYAEEKPKGFGFSDTAFRIFILMASRRLKSDRFFTSDLKPEVYTDVGLNWITDNCMKSILLRHYPTLAASLAGVDNPFAPWPRAERPLADPVPAKPFRFSTIPIAAGAAVGATSGILKHVYAAWSAGQLSLFTPLHAAVSPDAGWGAAIGAAIAGVAVSTLHLVSSSLDRRWSGSGKAGLVYVAAVIVAIGRAAWEAAESRTFGGVLNQLATWETLRAGAVGGLVGLAILGAAKLPGLLKPITEGTGFWEQVRFRLSLGGMCGVAGALVGALIHVLRGLDTSGALLPASLEEWPTFITTLLGALVSIEAMIAAAVGVAIGATSAFLGAAYGALFGGGLGMVVHLNPWLAQVNIPTLEYNATSDWTLICIAVGAVVGLAKWRGGIPVIRGAIWGWLVGIGMGMAGFLAGKGIGPRIHEGLVAQMVWAFLTIGTVTGIVVWLFYHSVQWAMRKQFWNLLAFLKFSLNKPLKIAKPRAGEQVLKAVPIRDVLREIPLSEIKVAHAIPNDERSWKSTRYLMKAMLFPFQRWLYRVLPAMQPGLPSVDKDPQLALDRVYRGFRKRLQDTPDLVPEYEGSPDLGRLAVRSPYACYTTRVLEGEPAGDYEWNLLDLDRYAVHPYLYPLGCRVRFRVVNDPADARGAPHCNRLDPYRIDYREDGKDTKTEPGAPDWPFAKRLALCAVSNHMTLIRHWNWVHLAPAAHLAIATRNHLAKNHPVGRLLWPHIFGTQQSNYFGTMAQMGPGGDFPETFSFTFPAMCQLFADTYRAYDFAITDPYQDRVNRGLLNPEFATPSQDNLEELFAVMLSHTTRFVQLYYDSVAVVHDDTAVMKWLEELNRLIPNGTGIAPGKLSSELLAGLLARCIYLVTVQHEMVGSQLWNYQLWTHRQPVRLYKNQAREPEDVYQRLVNMNFMLHVKRTSLMDDYSFLAEGLPKEASAEKCFRDFRNDLKALDTKMRERSVWAPWLIYPKDLEANINA
jgi:hypothetical protein